MVEAVRNRMRETLLGATAMWALAGFAHPARADFYLGVHPVDDAGGWHLSDPGLHEHPGSPWESSAYGRTRSAGHVTFIFLGDPSAFGFRGELWSYDGAHPLAGTDGYCGIHGVHDHPFPPHAAAGPAAAGPAAAGMYVRRGEAYRYVGPLRGGLAMLRPARLQPRRPIVPGTPAVVAPNPLCWNCPGRRRVRGPTPRRSRTGTATRRPSTYFDGRYARTRGRPAVRGRTAPPSRQR